MAEGEENSGGKKKRIIIIVVAVFLLLGGGAAAWFMLSDDTPKAEEQPVTQERPVRVAQAYYVIMPQPFIFNVTGDKRDRLVQVKVQLMVRGDSNEEMARQHIPLIESTLLQTFSAATVEQLRTSLGRIDLRQQALSAIQDAMMKVSGEQVVERVLFTGFVMQ